MQWNHCFAHVAWVFVFLCIFFSVAVAIDSLQPIPFDGANETMPLKHLKELAIHLVPAAFYAQTLAANVSDIINEDMILIPDDITLSSIWQIEKSTSTTPLFVIKNEDPAGGYISELPQHFVDPHLIETENLSTIITSGASYFHSTAFIDIQSAIPVGNRTG